MLERIKWWHYELKRLHRLWIKPERSAHDLCRVVGVWWLWRHGAKREFRVWPWAKRREWYAIDVALPHKMRGLEAKGAVHRNSYNVQRDIVREQRLHDRGWSIISVTDEEMKQRPKAVRRRVRRFLAGR